jgi:predicted small lipoprotein YifL
LKSSFIAFALIAALAFTGAACGKKEAPAAGTAPAAEQAQTAPSAAGSPENLGKKIGSSYIETLKQVVAMLNDRLPAEEIKAMLKEMKAGTIDLMVGLGKEREAFPPADRAAVDLILSNRISGVPADLFKEYQDGQAYYKDDSELFNLIADFNIITQYANFDLLKKQLPEEAKRLGIQ